MQFIQQQPMPRPVRLKPLAINHQLRNGAFAHVTYHFSRRLRIRVHIHFGVLNPVSIEKMLRRAAVAAPAGCIDLNLHAAIVLARSRCYM